MLENVQNTLNIIEEYRSFMSNIPKIINEKENVVNLEEKEVNILGYSQFEIESKLIKILKKLSDSYRNSKDIMIDIGILEAEDVLVKFIIENRFDDIRKTTISNKTKDDLDNLIGVIKAKGINKKKKSSPKEVVDIDDISLDFLNEFNDSSSKFFRVRINTLNGILSDRFSRLGDIMHYNSCSFYCPYCNEDIIKEIKSRDYSDLASGKSYEPISFKTNSKVFLKDWKNEVWKCKFCERETHTPIPVHKMYEEVFLPTYNILLLENEKDRLKIYSKFREKLLEYQKDYDNESSVIIRENQRDLDIETYKLKSLESKVKSNSRAVEKMEQLLIELEVIYKEDLERINKYLVEARDKIFKEYKDNADKLWKDFHEIENRTSREISKLAVQARIEQAARDEIMVKTLNTMSEISKNIKDTALNTENIAKNTKQTSINTALSVRSLNGIGKNTKSLAAMDLSRGRKEGLDKHPLNPLGYL